MGLGCSWGVGVGGWEPSGWGCRQKEGVCAGGQAAGQAAQAQLVDRHWRVAGRRRQPTRPLAAACRHFLFDVAKLTGDWTMQNVLDEEIAKIKAAVGPTDHVICALSGGVDSTVAATLVHRVLGDRLHCVFVDNGLLRYKVQEGGGWEGGLGGCGATRVLRPHV